LQPAARFVPGSLAGRSPIGAPVLVTLPSYEGTWYVSIAVDDEFAGGIARRICGALSITALVLFLEPGPLDY
jgi:hypothetical protein